MTNDQIITLAGSVFMALVTSIGVLILDRLKRNEQSIANFGERLGKQEIAFATLSTTIKTRDDITGTHRLPRAGDHG